MLELRNDVPLQVLTGLGARVEGRHEEAPVLETIAEIRDVLGFELEEELPDAPSPRSRLKGDAGVCRPDPDAWDEAERRLKGVPNLLPVEEHIPPIVGIRKTKAARVVLAKHLVVCALNEQVERDVLVAAKR